MSLKAKQIERIVLAVTALAALDCTVTGVKKSIREEASKATRGYGVMKAYLDELPVTESLVKELGGIKPTDGTSQEEFQAALSKQRDLIVASLETLKGQVEAVEDVIISDAASDPTGSRSAKVHEFVNKDGETVMLTISEISKTFKDSTALANHVSNPEISLSKALKDHFNDDLNIELAKEKVYEIYRPVRPAAMRKIKELRGEAA